MIPSSAGITIAIRDSGFHLALYLCSAVLFIAYQSQVRRAALGVRGVWLGMVCFQWLRLAAFLLRHSFVLNRKSYQVVVDES